MNYLAEYIVSWIFFFFLHSALASSQVKERLSPYISFKYYRLFYNALSIMALIPVGIYYYLFEARYYFQPVLISQLTGILLMIWSLYLWKKTFENYSLSEFAGTDRFKTDYTTRLVLKKGGLNKMVRHPLYSISYLFLIALWILLPTDINGVTALLIFVYFPIGIYFEERKLIRVFGEKYLEYKKETPALFPRLTTSITTGKE